MVPIFGTKKRSQPFVNFFNEWCPILGQKKRSQPFVNFLTSGAQFWDKKTQPTICKFFQCQSGAQFGDKKTQPTICEFSAGKLITDSLEKIGCWFLVSNRIKNFCLVVFQFRCKQWFFSWPKKMWKIFF